MRVGGLSNFSLVESGPGLGGIDLEAFESLGIHGGGGDKRSIGRVDGEQEEYKGLFCREHAQLLYLPAGLIKNAWLGDGGRGSAGRRRERSGEKGR